MVSNHEMLKFIATVSTWKTKNLKVIHVLPGARGVQNYTSRCLASVGRTQFFPENGFDKTRREKKREKGMGGAGRETGPALSNPPQVRSANASACARSSALALPMQREWEQTAP